jgi:SAM-dependent methyltransferase
LTAHTVQRTLQFCIPLHTCITVGSRSFDLTEEIMAKPPSTPPPQDPGPFWDQRYAAPGFAFGEAPNAWLAAQRSHFKVGMRALVPGDGEGRNGVWLAELGLNVMTVDASRIGVHKANLLAAERGVTIDARVADLTRWTWPQGVFDVVAAIYLHWPAALRAAMHAKMLQALKPGGLLVLEGYTPRQVKCRAAGAVGGPSDPSMLFEPQDLKGDFIGADIERLEEEEVVLDEGTRHKGRSAVVRMLVRCPPLP